MRKNGRSDRHRDIMNINVDLFINPLAPELFFFLILAHPVYKM